jgi:hypothetical protein
VGNSPETHTGKVDDVSRDPRQAALDSQRELMKLMVQYYMDNEYDEDEDDESDAEYDE